MGLFSQKLHAAARQKKEKKGFVGTLPFATPKTESTFFNPRATRGAANSNDPRLKDSDTLNTRPTPASAGAVPRVSSKAFQQIDAQITSHVHHPSTIPYLGLPPVDASRRLSSSPRPGLSEVQPGSSSIASENLPLRSSMQTPPPTATAQEKKQDPHNLSYSPVAMADPQKLTTPKLSRMKHPQTPGHLFDASPQLFTNLQFSPDLFQYGMSGPATAPVLPQSRLFWESDPTNGDLNNAETDPFFSNQTSGTSHSASSPVVHGNVTNISFPHSRVPFGFSASDEVPQTVLSSPSRLDGPRFPAPFTASPRVPVTRAEDPSMFLSSPARRFGPTPQSSASLLPPQAQRQPYHHQIEDSKREQATTRLRKPKEKRHPHDENRLRQDEPPLIGRPGIRRSVTHSGIGNPERHAHRQNRALFMDGTQLQNMQSRPSSTGGRVSPLKRSSQQAGLDRPSSRARGSLTLTIDEHGRAKTVFTAVSESLDTKMTFDDDVSEGDTSIDSADFNIVNSRNTSFVFSDTGMTIPKPNYLRPDSKTHSKNSSYSSAPGSSVSTNLSSRTSSLQATINPRSISQSASSKDVISRNDHIHTGYRASSLATLQSSQRGLILENLDEDTGDAQQALRALKKDRPRRNQGTAGHSDSRDTSIRSFHSSPPVQANAFDAYFNNTMLSPTTITDPDLATPSTDRESSSSGSTRCVCNSSEHWGHMIQWYAPQRSRLLIAITNALK
ncbi:MAG: hypothetical protein Q9160_002723 [Pyrenula sp. 1 TL-2023]